ncbi:DUF2968 domain-containing protein [Paraburkholderia sp. SARCC-3016]|uniref:DUF2968 domain-containing protein n=1 Tax=Paraburkholderia sp. SARCC-3016 TaxID=3058611 RepID=UPI0028071B59|nr:DUF2968 domain-containing protein [Paraburkholderia sp. SARCC-3016]MDQ7977908.1 DUF2968 domain-containing protein [Paraburkholderia sp. SARCC-3016]
MDQKSKARQIVLSVLIATGGMQAAFAQEAVSDSAASGVAVETTAAAQPDTLAASSVTSGQTIALTPDEAKQSATGNVAELQQMIHGPNLTEMRTTYNGSYGASLMFYGKEVTYYVALFQKKNFWRVIKTSDDQRAEMIYRDFVRQTAQLSEVEIRRTKLEAQKAFTDHLIELSQDRANRLQADLSIARQQQTIVNSQQAQNRAEASALQQQKTQAQAQLRDAQRQVRELQRQLDSGLPIR